MRNRSGARQRTEWAEFDVRMTARMPTGIMGAGV